MITLKLHGVEELQAELDRRLELMHRNVEGALDWFGKTTTEEMIETHTFQNRTFRLEGSIDYDLYVFVGNEAHLAVFALAPYASQVEEGHPGPPAARPYPFFWPVFYTWEPVLYEKLQTAVEFALYDGNES